ncbi:GNAT family N-acetyltransferase [Microbulbifer bruguierae]|uniref:GNAT family N-acetyltransferase n=1 Tax=Microbulbifer bruguierae TaxID=3029061 RepID=A0ABY8NK71_9GAMM|nr:GNAT family N-acetyltransferase [Microbulbifer bruguierae]WGL18107.1 GNAT family N-acetyltransferase [Microbulbifer bruguierae]
MLEGLQIIRDDLTGKEIAELLQTHIDDMRATSPPESKHALDLDGLRQPDITFWSVYDGDQLVGCGALKALSADHGEIKSMRTGADARGRGVGSAMLQHIIAEARRRGYTRLSLETGSMAFFQPAHRLYRRHGFTECPPFAEYTDDPNSLFLELVLCRD